MEKIKENSENTPAYYDNLRNKIKSKSSLELEKRVIEKPLADIDDINLGVYKEMLEEQCRDAIIKITNKGWITFESGFLKDNQYIGFSNICLSQFEENKDNIKLGLFDIKSKYSLKDIEIRKKEDRFQIVIDCSNKRYKQEELKEIFDDISDIMPKIDVGKNGVREHGTQFIAFIGGQFIDRIFSPTILQKIEEYFANSNFLKIIKEIEKEEKKWKKVNIFLDSILGLKYCKDENDANFGAITNLSDLKDVYSLYDFSFLAHDNKEDEEEKIYERIKQIGDVYNQKYRD